MPSGTKDSEYMKKLGENTQFKPGQSGNPTGPKPGYKHLTTHIQELLNDDKFTTMIQQGYEVVEYKGKPIDALLHAQLKLALNSRDESIRLKATDMLMKYGWSAKSEVDLTTQGEKLETGLDAARIDQLIRARSSRADLQGSST